MTYATCDTNRHQVLKVATDRVLDVIQMNSQVTKTDQTTVTHL